MGSSVKRILADFVSLSAEEQEALLIELICSEGLSFVPFAPPSASESEIEHLIKLMQQGLPFQEGPLKRDAIQ
jgi:hypothetical protein